MSYKSDQLKMIFGSRAAVIVLRWLVKNDEGFLRQICRETDLRTYEVKRQLDKFHNCGILIKRREKNRNLFRFRASKITLAIRRILR
jgi:predicted DNA-binding transcriptional regulator